MTEETEKKWLSDLPNRLTIFRVACIPLVVFFLSFQGRWMSFFAALFMGMAFVTDFLDGYYARKYGAVTVLGKFLDPLADKILVSVSMIMLIPLGRIPILVVIVIIAREMAVTGLRTVAVNEGIVIQASDWGKFKTIFQAVAILALTLHYEYVDVNFHAVGMLFLWAALILTLWSGWKYFSQFYKVFSPEKREE
ncbi:CDP-diacylglycerol--glycerol-3-phosphate 3-phosphatidyltransferase [Thermodesulfobacteriota bacterium]